MTGRIMAVDPGEKRIGVAVSDETRTLARGVAVISHVSMKVDCETIARLAREKDVALLLVGNAVGENGEERPQNRHAARMVEMLADLTGLRTILWDESGSTRRAQTIHRQLGGSKAKRSGHLDDTAAAVILQSWLDSIQEDDKYDAP